MNYANIKYNDVANGIGIRTSLFVSGCTHHCKGCFNQCTWDFNYGKLYTKEVEDNIIKSCEPYYVDGLSLLGGEPFEKENQKDLLELVKRFKEKYPTKNIWCYSGYLFEEILDENSKIHTSYTKELLSYIDILVDGEFKLELKSLALKFKGSSNQRIINVNKSLKENNITLFEVEKNI